MYCYNCGKKLPEDYICSKCGTDSEFVAKKLKLIKNDGPSKSDYEKYIADVEELKFTSRMRLILIIIITSFTFIIFELLTSLKCSEATHGTGLVCFTGKYLWISNVFMILSIVLFVVAIPYFLIKCIRARNKKMSYEEYKKLYK